MNKKIALTSIFLMAFLVLVPLTTKAVDVEDVCPVSLDNDTSDWAEVDALFSEPGSTIGTNYYWDGTQWLTSEPDSYEYSTNVDQMADLENIKICNDIDTMYLYVDAQHPIFGVYNVAEQKYEEFPNPEESHMGMPQAFDYWMVYEMQKQDADDIYFLAIHLVSALGDAGLESGPTKVALYEDNGDGVFSSADTELADFDTEAGRDEYEGVDDGKGKEFDQEGGLEVAMELVNKDGEGLFTSTNIDYGNTLNMSVAMYPNDVVQTMSADRIATAAEIDQTQDFEYQIKKVGVQNVRIPKQSKYKKKVTIKWDEITDATKYTGKLYLGNKYKRTFTTTSTQKVVKKLKYYKKKNYKVKIRAKISTVNTPWSDQKTFKAKK